MLIDTRNYYFVICEFSVGRKYLIFKNSVNKHSLGHFLDSSALFFFFLFSSAKLKSVQKMKAIQKVISAV